jgi:class 3 adenylate cyclase
MTLVFLILFRPALAEETVFALDGKKGNNNISSSVSYLKDSDSKLTFEDIKSGKYDGQFVRNTGASLSFGNVEATIWHKFVIRKSTPSSDRWLLVVDNHHLDSITFYYADGKGGYNSEHSGRLISYNLRKYKYNTFVFDLPFETADSQKFYLKVSSYLLKYPIQVIRYDTFSDIQLKRSITMGALVGFLLMIVLYNLFIYFTERDKNYLYYIVYVSVSCIKISDTKGYMDFFWQGPLSFMQTQTPGLTLLLGVFMTMFTGHILDFRKNLPKAYNWILAIFGPMLLASLFFNIIDDKLYSSLINQLGSISLTFFLYICALVIYRKGYRVARFYIIAVSAYFLSIMVYTLSLLGVLPFNNFTDNLIELGVALEMLLFSLALADKIREYKKAKKHAEMDLMRTMKENERLILDQNKILEIKVEERTHDLIREKEKSDNLLLNILPSEIAEELKERGESEAKMFENVSVLFTDFVNFTGVSEKFTPTALVHEINHCFTAFDHMVGRIGLEKIKTIGDAYLAVCGLPAEDPDHAIKSIQVALEIREFIDAYYKGGGAFQIRIGVHSGPLVAGIVGVKKFAYDIWGDTVNTAARMEQNSEAGKINISGATFKLVKDVFVCHHRGKISAKNKGEIDMYFVERMLSEQEKVKNKS